MGNKVFFPGEVILNHIEIDNISLCQVEKNESFSQLLIRPINIYEVSYSREYKTKIEKSFQSNKLVNLIHNVKYPYNSGERIKTSGQVEILNQFLSFKLKNSLKKGNRVQIKILNDKRKKQFKLFVFRKIFFGSFC